MVIKVLRIREGTEILMLLVGETRFQRPIVIRQPKGDDARLCVVRGVGRGCTRVSG
jgi:hypothetical protein